MWRVRARAVELREWTQTFIVGIDKSFKGFEKNPACWNNDNDGEKKSDFCNRIDEMGSKRLFNVPFWAAWKQVM